MYETVIGLEVHVQLATQSKAFCNDPNAFGAAPNSQVSEVSLGYPGTLPFLNERHLEYAVRLGLALGCTINRRSTFDRKNYFYADLPKGYQITQDERPICIGGALPLVGTDRAIQLHHIHMEEDAGKLLHDPEASHSLVDLNRAGTPLLEIVTEPDLRSAEEVDAFLTGIRQLVRWLDISDGNMEEGSLRCDVNISVRPRGQSTFGTRTEIKNMNSMRFARRAIAYEVDRQIGLLKSGKKVLQQTRQYDPVADRTTALRTKEDAHDYRYFPEPDLPPVELSEGYVNRLRATLGELPWQAADRMAALGIHEADARLITQHRTQYLAFLDYVDRSADPVDLGKLWINRLLPYLQRTGDLPITPAQVAEVQALVRSGQVSAANASSRLLPDLLECPGAVAQRATDLGIIQTSDTHYLAELAQTVIAEYPEKAAAYRSGKKGLIGFFMGEVMRRSRGSAEPKETRSLLQGMLG